MIITVNRFARHKKSTLGTMLINGNFEAFTLEDAERCEKISGMTAIPEGSYQVKFREEDTPLTKRYQERFSWFTYHLHLQDVPNYQFVYIHVGNTQLDTEGCLLVGDTAINDPNKEESKIGKSVQSFTRLYQMISDTIKSGEEVWVVIA